ncbi:hypothetical protein ABZ943_21475 [Streptomyces rubiginosohelvolus]|uniref:hypothetical protein n=1 Tax=Streptomyces rubiginosohelvolus TaxID=67362 RepID=UPI0033F584F7
MQRLVALIVVVTLRWRGLDGGRLRRGAAMAGTGFAQFMPSSASAAMSRGGFSDQWVVGWPGLISLVWVAMVFRVELSPLGGGGPGLSSLS